MYAMFLFQVQDEDETETECAETTICYDDADDNHEMTVECVKSTKEPTGFGKRAKRQKLESLYNELLERAIKCFDHATTSAVTTNNSTDSTESFGRYVTLELRTLNPCSQRCAKFKIQQIIFDASSQSDGNGQFTLTFYSPPALNHRVGAFHLITTYILNSLKFLTSLNIVGYLSVIFYLS